MKLEKIFIIADDITGATGVGASFLGINKDITVFLNVSIPKNRNAINIINTNTRSANSRTAYYKLKKLFENVNSKIIFKKIDSAFRGNVSIEIKAIIDTINPDNIFVIPSIPEINRFTIDGSQYIKNTKIEEFFKSNPVNSIKTSFIPDSLGEYIKEDIQLVNLKDIRCNNIEINKKIVVFDSVNYKDIDLILKKTIINNSALFVGSLGLFNSFTRYLKIDKSNKKEVSKHSESILFICGSKNKISHKQIEYAKRNKIISLLKIDFTKSFNDLFVDNIELFKLNKNLILIIDKNNKYSSFKIQNYFENLIELILKRTKYGIIAVFGGDTLFNICNKLEIKKLTILDQISPVVEVSITESKFGKLMVISKGGSVGSKNIIYRILNYFK